MPGVTPAHSQTYRWWAQEGKPREENEIRYSGFCPRETSSTDSSGGPLLPPWPLRETCVCVCAQLLNHVQLFVILWTGAHQAPLSRGFSRQEYWSGLPCPSPGNLPNPGITPGSPAWQEDSLPSQPPGKPGNHLQSYCQTSISDSPGTQIKSSNRKFWENNKNS